MTEFKNINAVPEPSLRRLPVYRDYLKKVKNEGGKFISCTQISEALNLIAVQIRKDLAFTGIVGKPKVGYDIDELLASLDNFLGLNNTTEAFLVGAGNLGTALLSYEGFDTCGLHIIAAFDNDLSKIGREINKKKILPIEKFQNLTKRMKINIGIMAVPAGEAQKTADLMINSGIKAIWNFTSAKISAPEKIIIQHENFAASFLVLSKKLKGLL
ncbi:MAG TPA: redox-sensing transcriptional repressor Rex [Candidatus Wallbacteria bacterium]|nr:MAG: Redox-sensing transcriptional repressor Rex [bacterium ADurb.Bin243]HOD39290.1 redox-sensing transcriptional repressor Rex [Candidatus Wallbacteria bacterium]HOT76595.1 redox-sensing transcriptional repressor Rex [Candidatus Wallbacteria bacterium]